jgi:signal transduction histidine kinase
MRSRGRSIRLRIYFLVTIPLVMMVALAGIFSYTSITTWLNLARAPGLINATSVPITQLVNLIQTERRAGIVYLSQPDSSNLRAYQSAVAATRADATSLSTALNSGSTKSSENAQEAAAIGKLVTDVNGMSKLREAVQARKMAPLETLAAYTNVIIDAPAVFESMATSLTNTTVASQGLALIGTVNAHEDLSEQDAVLAGALAAGSLTPAERVVFDQAAGRQQDATALFTTLFSPSVVAEFNTTLNKLAPQAVQKQVTTVQQAVEGGATIPQLEAQGLNSAAWQQLITTMIHAHYQAGLTAAAGTLTSDQGLVNSYKTKAYLIGGIGLAGLLFTVIVTTLLARSINRRLTRLRRSALALATDQLPATITRLRRGEKVDITESPTVRVGNDEIGQVGQAIEMVRQSALRSAIEESRVRSGVNDMFRNLARRNQSLLQRQLTMLDSMERRATDPDVLDDLFKMDHLTTRMRRHAEGLIILSGAAPGRGWSSPVKLVDVMRGAVAEVEDFARVIVITQSKAALTGSAVTDVIHLLAELIENAATLSPPFTQVRVSGEMVANGFAIEIEDRGLGMTQMRMQELNERLHNPPDVNPANTEQLGLFVVGQLARRHGIRVSLQPSPYGGTTAIVMLPQRLVADDSTPAIAASPTGTFGQNGAFAGGAGGGFPDGIPRAYGAATGANNFRDPNGASGMNGNGARAVADRGAGGFNGARAAGGPPDLDTYPVSSPFTSPGLNPPDLPSGPGNVIPGSLGGDSLGGGSWPGAQSAPQLPGPPQTRPAARPTIDPYPSQPPRSGGGFDSGAPAFERRGQGASAPSFGTAPGPAPNGPAGNGFDAGNGFGNNGAASGPYAQQDPAGEDLADFKGLPRRQRQANLAPQLASSSSAAETEIRHASAPDPADVRNTLSAMQRGWKQGRSQSQRDTEGH